LRRSEFQELNQRPLAEIREFLLKRINSLTSNQAQAQLDQSLKLYLDQKSADTLKRIKNGESYDVVVVGAGVSGGQFVSGMAETAKSTKRLLKTLLLEEGDRVASNFHSLDFTLNSAEAYVHPDNPNLGEIARLTEINPTPGSPLTVLESGVMIPLDHRIQHQAFLSLLEHQGALVFPWTDYLGFNVFPKAHWLGRSSELAVFSSNTDIAFHTKALNILKKENGLYYLQTSQGVVKTKHIVMATGLGEDIIPFQYTESLREQGKLLTFSDLLDIARSEPSYQNFMKEISGKKVLVVGKGDGGNVAVEYVMDLVQTKKSPYQLPHVSWSSLTTDTKESFLESLGVGRRGTTSGGPLHHQRYQALGDLIEQKKISLIAERIDSIEELQGGKMLVHYQGDKESEVFDLVVAATGYRNELLPGMAQSSWKPIQQNSLGPVALKNSGTSWESIFI
jgi:hypothetical protein